MFGERENRFFPIISTEGRELNIPPRLTKGAL